MVQIEIDGQSSVPRAGAPSSAMPIAASAVHRLMTAGAIMTLFGSRPEQHLVGHLEWLGPERLFWFTAYGESVSDGHLLEFDALHAREDRGVFFSRGGSLVSSLTLIEEAEVEDPDDYRIAWQLWQEVAPLRRRLIEASCATLTRDSVLIDGVDGEHWPRITIAPNGKRVSHA